VSRAAAVIRPARLEDAEALAAIDRRVVLDGRGVVRTVDQAGSAERFRQTIAGYAEPDGLLVVAEVDGVVVGEGTVRRHAMAFCRHNAIFALQVDPLHQGRGVGRAISDALVAWADAHDVERLQLSVRSDNIRAIRLYRSLGFYEEMRRIALLRIPGGRWVDDLSMLRVNRPPEHEKAAAAVVRRGPKGPEICVFGHPLAGWQLPKGTIEPGEDPAEAVVREVQEETGLVGRVVAPLGAWTMLMPSGSTQRWHGFVVAPPDGGPDRWDHVARGSAEEDGLVFELRWIELSDWTLLVLPAGFHEVVHRALAQVRRG
jgi:ribosomal protein S18 acetylase RimI-like enzyme